MQPCVWVFLKRLHTQWRKLSSVYMKTPEGHHSSVYNASSCCYYLHCVRRVFAKHVQPIFKGMTKNRSKCSDRSRLTAACLTRINVYMSFDENLRNGSETKSDTRVNAYQGIHCPTMPIVWNNLTLFYGSLLFYDFLVMAYVAGKQFLLWKWVSWNRGNRNTALPHLLAACNTGFQIQLSLWFIDPTTAVNRIKKTETLWLLVSLCFSTYFTLP